MTTRATKERSTYAEAWAASQVRAEKGLPAWAARLRERAFEAFERNGFPTTDEEDWKYTNVAPIARAALSFPDEDEAARADVQLGRLDYPEAARSRLVFVNGVFRADLCSLEALPDGILVANLRDALAGEAEPIVREHLGRTVEIDAEPFSALNTAFLGHGAFVHLKAGVTLEAPLHLLFLTDAGGGSLVTNPRVLVVAEPGSAATIIESYESVADATYLTNAVVEVSVGDEARVTHYKVQRESVEAFHVATTNAVLGRAATYDLTTITLGARLSRHAVSVRMPEEGAECWVDGLYLVGGGQHADTHSIIDHVAPRCASHQLYKGVLDGKSRAVFNGRVFVRRDAQQTDARQTNRNLLLSPEARVDTKPQLEIFADDVKCSHGATVGQLEEDELFYLKSRGLHDELARNLLTYGFAEELVEKIKIDGIRAQLNETILNRLHARLEV